MKIDASIPLFRILTQGLFFRRSRITRLLNHIGQARSFIQLGKTQLLPISTVSSNKIQLLVLKPPLYIMTSEASSADGASAGDTTEEPGPKILNRLSNEKSPYLLQHAGNPVDWYPWGEEAFQKAKDENKMIFLSVGYSTCHWCHVMERESFENRNIAKIMNENFVNIKVDREERPDVDKIYMTFVQATTGGGGWPMSVWLTPDLKPVLGGTYFPPDDRYFGRPGFSTVLTHVGLQWKENQDKVNDQGTRILDILMQTTTLKAPEESGAGPPPIDCVHTCFEQLCRSYDKQYGGFGTAPKFPQPVNLNFLFRLYALNPSSKEGTEALHMCLHTLKMMAKGGMHDHISQGFHRYSTDGNWHVPHFEKMLYDQGQLAASYFDAYQISKDDVFSDIAQDILKYVSRDLSDKNGGFYSAEDADSLPTFDDTNKREGAFCVWTDHEVKEHLKESVSDGTVTLADIFCSHYNIQPSGNVNPYQDPHDELKNQNVLIVNETLEETAERYGLSKEVVKESLEKAKHILYDVRQNRPRPHLDDKFVSSWNGLMISGFSRGAQALQDSQYSQRALEAAKFLRKYLYNENTKQMLRSAYKDTDGSIVQGTYPISGVLEDYVYVIQGLMDLYEACYDPWCIEWASELQEAQDELFWDDDDGAYFNSVSTDSSIVLRLKEDQDGAEPSANSVAVSNLIRLSGFLNNPDLRNRAAKLLAVFGERLTRLPVSLPQMVCGLMNFSASTKQIIIVGDKDDPNTISLLNCVHGHFLPFKILILADGNKDSIFYQKIEVLEKLEKIDGNPTAYVCQNYACSLPVTTVKELDELLTKESSVEHC